MVAAVVNESVMQVLLSRSFLILSRISCHNRPSGAGFGDTVILRDVEVAGRLGDLPSLSPPSVAFTSCSYLVKVAPWPIWWESWLTTLKRNWLLKGSLVNSGSSGFFSFFPNSCVDSEISGGVLASSLQIKTKIKNRKEMFLFFKVLITGGPRQFCYLAFCGAIIRDLKQWGWRRRRRQRTIVNAITECWNAKCDGIDFFKKNTLLCILEI